MADAAESDLDANVAGLEGATLEAEGRQLACRAAQRTAGWGVVGGWPDSGAAVGGVLWHAD
jgi:hypothetical protein